MKTRITIDVEGCKKTVVSITENQNNFDLNRAMIFGSYREGTFVKNIDTFEPLKLAESEPIDESLNFARLNFHNPEQYESAGQWRTAHMAWKIYRDWVASEFNKKLTHNANVDKESEQIKQAEKKINELGEKTKKIASEYYYAAMAAQEKDARFKGLLRALLYDPKHSDALQNLKLLNQQFRMLEYKVKPNDSLKKIAKSVYGNERKAILIPIFNAQIQNDGDLTPGEILKLPKKPKKQIIL